MKTLTREGPLINMDETTVQVLKGFSGVLQTDGYAGYNKAVSEYGLSHVGCLAHARRKFHEASKVSKKKGHADEALAFFRKLYRIEKELRQQNQQPPP